MNSLSAFLVCDEILQKHFVVEIFGEPNFAVGKSVFFLVNRTSVSLLPFR